QCVSSDAELSGFGDGEGQRYGSEDDGLIHRLPLALMTALPRAEIRASEGCYSQRTSAHRIACASRPREYGRQALLVRTCPQANTRESTSRRQRDRVRFALCSCDWASAALCGRVWATGRAVQSRRVRFALCNHVWATGRRTAGSPKRLECCVAATCSLRVDPL